MSDFLKTLTKQVKPETDKRSATRLSVTIPVLYRIVDISPYWKTAKSINVSSNGVRLVMAGTNVETGSQLEIRLKLPKMPQMFELTGTVVWAKPRGETDVIECGLVFEQIKRLSHKEKISHFFADRVCVLAFKNLGEFETRPATTFDELKQAYQLLYKEYLARGYRSENPSEIHFNYFCALPETQTFILNKTQDIVGTISLVPDSPCGLPMESFFPDEIQELRKSNQKLAEVCLFSLFKNEFQGYSLGNFKKMKASFQLFAAVLHYAHSIGVTHLVIGNHPKHETLYKYLMFDTIGSAASYPGACGQPTLLMCMNVRKFMRNIQGKPLGYCWDRFLSLQAKQPLRNHYIWNSKSIDELFRLEPTFLETIPQEAKTYIQKCYPE
jgi:hypothetical protein